MIEKLQLHDRGSNLICYLKMDQLSNMVRNQTLNGQHTLEMTFAPNVEFKDSLCKYNRIVFFEPDKNRWQEFTIASVVHTAAGVTINCESSFYSTLCCFVPRVTLKGKGVVNGLYDLFAAAYPKSEWEVGTSDISGEFDLECERVTLKEAIYSWMETCGGEIETTIEVDENGKFRRKVSIYEKLGEDRGVTLYDDREITDAERKVPQGDLYTAAYGFGSRSSDGALDFTMVQWSKDNGDPVDKPLGQAYVSLGSETVEKLGQKSGNGFVDRCTCYTFDVEDAAELLQKTYDALAAQVLDDTNYSITVADLTAMGNEHAQVELGDTAGVSARAIHAKFRTRCISEKVDYLDRLHTTYEFNSKPVSVTHSMNSVGKTAQKAQNMAQRAYYAKVLEKFNREIDADQAHVVADPYDGLNTYNHSDPTQATKATSLKGGSVRIANSKTDGQWNWTSVLTGDGLVINNLTAQKIEGENFELDMQSGLLAFGQRVDGILAPVIQLQSTGFEILGDQVNARFSAQQMAFLNKVNGNVIAQFSSDGAQMPTAIVNEELMIGSSRVIPLPQSDAVMWVINDENNGGE